MSKTQEISAQLPEIWMSEASNRIFTLRGCQVMLDSDLAQIYEVETKNLKKAVRRNLERFPRDFMFELSKDELQLLRFQIGTSKLQGEFPVERPILRADSDSEILQSIDNLALRFQSGTSNFEGETEARGGNRYTPFVFTEPGVAMLSTVLHSDRAIQINISIMRVFIQLRARMLMNQVDLAPQLECIQSSLTALRQKFDQVSNQPQISANSRGDCQGRDRVKIIQNLVARYWGLRVEDLKSSTRTKAVSLARQIAIFLIRKHLGLGYHEIGQHFGQRDHTTILHAYRKIHADSEDIETVKKTIESLQNEIQLMLS